jgi:transcriptional antiterminator
LVVLLKAARGLSLGEIARELQVSRASISSDIAYLRNQAKESIREYTTDNLPEQYQVCLTALEVIIKRAFEILETSPLKSCTGNGTFELSYGTAESRSTSRTANAMEKR